MVYQRFLLDRIIVSVAQSCLRDEQKHVLEIAVTNFYGQSCVSTLIVFTDAARIGISEGYVKQRVSHKSYRTKIVTVTIVFRALLGRDVYILQRIILGVGGSGSCFDPQTSYRRCSLKSIARSREGRRQDTLSRVNMPEVSLIFAPPRDCLQ